MIQAPKPAIDRDNQCSELQLMHQVRTLKEEVTAHIMQSPLELQACLQLARIREQRDAALEDQKELEVELRSAV